MEDIKLNKVKHIREEQNLSVRELAKRCDLSHSYITTLENFECIPSQTNIMRVSRGLNKKVEEVFLLDYNLIDLDKF